MKKRVAGYIKLAKLWEKNREKAIQYHNEYYSRIYSDNDSFTLVGVYVDITGNKNIKSRPEMIRLLSDCKSGCVDQISVQTKGYLAANTREFCYLIKFLFDLDPPVDILSFDTDYHIDTLTNSENQKEELYRMANEYCMLYPGDYPKWRNEIMLAISEQTEGDMMNE